MVNLQETLDELDIFRKLFGMRLEDCYNLLLNKGWTLGSPQLTRGMQWLIRLLHPQQVRLLEKLWLARRPGPGRFACAELESRDRREHAAMPIPRTPFVTILTDIADYPPHFWIERQRQYLICGSERAVEQARELGHEDRFIFRTSGMILNPRFYQPVEIDRARRAAEAGPRPGAVRRAW